MHREPTERLNGRGAATAPDDGRPLQTLLGLEFLWGGFATLTHSAQRTALAEVLGLLTAGERLAAQTARTQQGLTADPATIRFFASQTRHEAMHARVFATGQRALQPLSTPGSDSEFANFASELARSLASGTLSASVAGCQVVLEGLGEALLGELDEGIRLRGLGLSRLRRIILEQERTHHGFGVALLEQSTRAGIASTAVIRRTVAQYVQIAIDLLERNRRLFSAFDVAPASLQARFLATVPAGWR